MVEAENKESVSEEAERGSRGMKVVVELSKEEMGSYKTLMRLGFGNTAMRKIINGTPLQNGIITTDKAIKIIRKYLGYSDGKPYDTVDAIIEDIMDEADKEGAEK